MKNNHLKNLRLRALALTAMLCTLFTGTLWGETRTETITFSKLGYQNGVKYETTTQGDVSITFGDSDNDGKYYTTGSGMRIYGGGHATFTANNQTITQVKLTFSGSSYAPSSSDSRDIWSPTTGATITTDRCQWNGSATSVTITRPSGSGHWRLQVAEITYQTSGGSTTETCATPTFSPASGTYTEAQSVTISTTTDGATIYYTTDGTDPTTSSSVYSSPISVSTTTTIKAMAVKADYNNSSVATAEYIINLPYSGEDYVRVNSLDYLTDGVKVIIAARYNATATSYYAMTAAASGKPTGVAFTSTTSSNGEILPATIVDSESTYAWTVGVTTDGYTFTNSNDKALGYTSSTNFAEGGDNTEWTISRATSGSSAMVSGYEGFYIVNKNNTGRGIALNNSYNYGPYATSNITSSDYNFYVDIFVQGFTPSTDPTISANNVNIAYNAIAGNIDYTLSNPVTGTALTAAVTDGSWLTLGTVGETAIPFTCTANESTEARTATVTLTYGSVTKTVTITQAAAPLIYTTIPALFEAATSTSTPVTVTFDNWVVTGVNGNQVFVTDGTNGFIIYQIGHGFEVGNTLSGTVSCNLVLFYGSAEITGLTSTTEGLTVGSNGSVTPVSTTIDALSAVNTGSVVTLSNLTYNGNVLSDGTNTIQLYTSLYHDASCESGKTYNVTGVFVLNNTDKRILPRGANDIEEVSSVTPVTGDKYVKVTSTDALTSGQYLIVYETDGVAFDGSLTTLDAVGNTIGVTITNNEIAATSATTAAEFTIDVAEGTIKSASGNYIGRTTDSNGMNSSDTEAYTNTISFTDGNADIVSSGGAYLRYNATSGQDRFRYFKSSSYTGQKAIQLYKKVEATPEPYTRTKPSSSVYGTLCLPYNATITGGTLYNIASASFTDPNTPSTLQSITLEEVGTTAEAGKGYIIKFSADEMTATFTSTTKVSEPIPNNGLIGNPTTTVQTVAEGESNFVLQAGQLRYCNTVAATNGEYRAYIDASQIENHEVPVGVKSINLFLNGVDAIDGINSEIEDAEIYNIAGQRMNKLQRGVNIVNGKKVLVK